jgi:glucose dehydrogenase
MVAGFVGVGLTALFFWMGHGMATDGMSGRIWENYIFELTFYYLINSLLILFAGALLIRRKQLGIAPLVIAFLSILASFLWNDGEINLFMWTVTSSMFLPGAQLATIYFLSAILVNVFRIPKWIKTTI